MGARTDDVAGGGLPEPTTSRSRAAARRRRFSQEVAPGLTRRLLGAGTVPFDPGVRTSAATVLRRDSRDATLAVLVAPGESAATTDRALAYGLTYQGDRDLLLVLPGSRGPDPCLPTIVPTASRLPWVATPVRIVAYDPDDPGSVVEVPRFAAVEVHQRSRIDTDLPLHTHDLGEREGWIAPLVERLEAQPHVVASHRSSYRSWHVLGRQVLLVRRTRGGIALVAGVAASRPGPDRPVPFRLRLDGPATGEQLDDAFAAADHARRARLDGRDTEHREAWLQSRLATPEGAAALGLAGPVLREFPAVRPPGGRAYVDLLGVDRRGVIHLVETKLGDDPMLALQGLDYRTWFEEHRTQVVDHLAALGHQVAADARVVIDYVVGHRDDGAHPALRYLPAQLETFDGSVTWRVGAVTGWSATSGPIDVAWAPTRTIPDGDARTQPPRYALRLQAHLTARVGDASGLERRSFHADPSATIRPAAATAIDELTARGLAHPMLGHVRSSQRFALELFAGLDADQRRALARWFDADVVDTEPVEFEHTDPHDRLREATVASPHATQVDVLLRTTRRDGKRHLVLIEVKLSEDDFNSCSAFASPHNPDRDVCRTPAPFGGDVDRCFQLRNHDREHRRRYDRHLPLHAEVATGAMCPFATSGNQPMRNVALAAALVADGEADVATFAVCAPDEHGALWRRWDDVRRTLPRPAMVQLASLPASSVLEVHHEADATRLADHYAIGRPVDVAHAR